MRDLVAGRLEVDMTAGSGKEQRFLRLGGLGGFFFTKIKVV
jgi:hypothetical protein